MRDVITKREQFQATMFGGRFHANKPIVGGRDPRGAPSAALFYWSHAVTTGPCEFGLHPHEGFEIMTFVFAGENAHYDTTTSTWTPLKGGEFQIIRSGSGLSHAERIAPGTRAFQIWFDPGIEHALGQPPAYEDHAMREASAVVDGSMAVTAYVGEGSRVRPMTEGLGIRKLSFAAAGEHALPLNAGKRYAFYVLAGGARLDGQPLVTDDVMNASGGTLRIAPDAGCELFVVELPVAPSYAPLTRPTRA